MRGYQGQNMGKMLILNHFRLNKNESLSKRITFDPLTDSTGCVRLILSQGCQERIFDISFGRAAFMSGGRALFCYVISNDTVLFEKEWQNTALCLILMLLQTMTYLVSWVCVNKYGIWSYNTKISIMLKVCDSLCLCSGLKSVVFFVEIMLCISGFQ